MSEQIQKWLKRRRVKHLINRALELDRIIKNLKTYWNNFQTAKATHETHPSDQKARLRYYYYEQCFEDNLSYMAYHGVISIEGAERELKEVFDKLDKERVDKTEQEEILE